jgi:hypothetical protein
MRIWDVPVEVLCRQHLLGEHRELHAIWSILVNGKKGYRNHPETIRWVGKEFALFVRHDEQIIEMRKRGYEHNSPLRPVSIDNMVSQNEYVNTLDEQYQILKDKKCDCRIQEEPK